MNNFNFVAPFYDLLARLVFGRAIESANSFHLHKIGSNSRVLILGGGTGQVLEALPKCESVFFIDSSKSMMERAKRRKGVNKVEFLVADVQTTELSPSYDVIICPFFLDCFNQHSLQSVLSKIAQALSKGGMLVVADFQGTSNSLLVKAMHLFFRLFSNLESKRLLNIHDFILQKDFSVQSEEFFHKNMIFSRVYGNL